MWQPWIQRKMLRVQPLYLSDSHEKNHSMRKLWEWINPICLSFFISSFRKFHWIILYFYVSICLNTFLQLKQEFWVKKKTLIIKKNTWGQNWPQSVEYDSKNISVRGRLNAVFSMLCWNLKSWKFQRSISWSVYKA